MILEVSNLDEAQKIISAKEAEIAILKSSQEKLKFELDQLRRMIFGSKSERFIPASDPSQLSLLDVPASAEAELKTTTVEKHDRIKKKVKHPVRNTFPDSLPREIITLYPEGFNENSTEKPIGKEVTEILEEIPGKLFVKRIERLKFAKPEGKGVAIASLPSRPIAKGLFGELLITRILVDKYCDHLPLNRQLERFKRAGMQIAYSTLADVPRQVCELFALLYSALKKQVLSSNYLQVDETPHPVLDPKVKAKAHRGYLWVYRSVEKRLVLFDYRKGRGKDGPKELLQKFSGFLQTDGYAVYDDFGLREDIILLGCMAHARRYFEQARDNDLVRSEYFMKQVHKLYEVERRIREEGKHGKEIITLRKEQSLPILKELEAWLKENIILVTPQSSIGKAIGYSLSRWTKLCEYVNHPLLEIDNNLVENAIRPTVLGRKNYLFSGSHEGAERSAMIYSFIGSCKMNGINPEEWFADVLLRLPETKSSQLSFLLPNNWEKA